ncbi:hypothetical protein LNKW23_47950 [Paralimibaculum aggregatum]|uniref:Uncharacterized protein n=1 Tax=Paralimibaculum aggregatum TaxID=3036245 RepID=A0ABQ6LU49_9RHOB|nr:hypothetical protein LNKW23_47950 [Limibaculum sp. NKW23]
MRTPLGKAKGNLARAAEAKPPEIGDQPHESRAISAAHSEHLYGNTALSRERAEILRAAVVSTDGPAQPAQAGKGQLAKVLLGQIAAEWLGEKVPRQWPAVIITSETF